VPTSGNRSRARTRSPRDADHAPDDPVRRLADLLSADRLVGIAVRDQDRTDIVAISDDAARLLRDLVHELAQAEISPATPKVWLTTQEAADRLHVSRPFLIGLLEKGEIPFRKVGTHRRILFTDLAAYKRRSDEARLNALDELAAEAQALGLGY
jgi:excisionase family DNA binding protein